MTRRELLLQAARLGSVSFAYGLLENTDLLSVPDRVDLRALRGAGPPKGRVLILGAGVAGQILCRPQGRVYFAGEHASRITAWMAGAFESARYVVKQIHTAV